MDADLPKVKLAHKVCIVYSYRADGSFKTEKLTNKTGGRPTSEHFGKSFLQFFYCESQLSAVCYGEAAHEIEKNTCMPENFCKALFPIQDARQDILSLIFRICLCFFQSFALSSLQPHSENSEWPLLTGLLPYIYRQGSSRAWAYLVHFGTPPLCHSLSSVLHCILPITNSASSRYFAQQAPDNTSQFILIASSL